MALRILRVCVGLSLMVSGALMYAASWQRWAGACPWGTDPDVRECDVRMDHLYDFLPPAEPWEPAGTAPELAGASMLVFAVALAVLPWALAGAQPGLGTVVVLSVCVIVVGDVAVAILRSGLADTVVHPVLGDLTIWLWILALPTFFLWLAFSSPGFASAAAVLLVLASPLIAAFSYAIGSFDANPWYEAVSGLLIVGAGACLLVHAARQSSRIRRIATEPAVV